MTLTETIYRRKSFRSYSDEQLSAAVLQDIENCIKNAKPLYPQIKFSWKIVGPEDMKCMQPWRAPHYIAMFTEEADGARENLGFVFQQVELYMQSIGLGSCWLGLGKLNEEENVANDGMDFAMMMAFGTPKDETLRISTEEFKRKTIDEISDSEDKRLECARVAPSAVNSQPWYFVHEGNTVHTYCMDRFFRKQFLGDMNKMDVGIALAQIYLENTDTFRYFTAENAPEVKANLYIGSFEI